MDPITIMLLLSVIGTITGAASSGFQSAQNIKLQKETNAQNIEMQKEINAQNQYNIEHAHQIEMADLQAAGLNPVLTATGGNGAPIQSLNSPKAVAPQMDLSGISSAMSGLTHMATMAMMMDMKESIAAERNNTLTAIAKGHDSTNAANAVLRNDTLNRLYQRKAATYINEGASHVNSAKFMADAAKKYGMSVKDFKKVLSYNWIK